MAHAWERIACITERRHSLTCREGKAMRDGDPVTVERCRRLNAMLTAREYRIHCAIQRQVGKRRWNAFQDRMFELETPTESVIDDQQELDEYIEWLWERKWIGILSAAYRSSAVVNTNIDQCRFIEACRVRFRYPDFAELVGPPDALHYDRNGRLTTRRKADLLLLGAFHWRGLWIARDADAPDRGKPWFVVTDSSFDPGRSLKLVYRPFERPLVTLSPFHGLAVTSLARYLVAEEIAAGIRPVPGVRKFRVIHADGDPFNCAPENLIVRGKGRPMICAACGSETTKQHSHREKLGDRYVRYCHQCLRELATWGKETSY